MRDNEGYESTWFDLEDDDSDTIEYYEITPTSNNYDIYITVESYYHAMIPESCMGSTETYMIDGY